MAITSLTQQREGALTVVTAVSNLATPSYVYWYLDGAFIVQTTSPDHSIEIWLTPGDDVRIEPVDSTDRDLDPLSIAPEGFPARRSVWWVRADDDTAVRYRVEQQRAGGAWSPVAEQAAALSQWAFSQLTARLDDQVDYAWRVVPIDAAGNDGTARTVAQEHVVRRPDSPDFTASFDPATSRVTFSEPAA